LKFYSSVRVDIRRISTIKDGDVAIGNQVRAKVVKNKVAAPFKTAEFDIMFDSGISLEGDLLDLALKEQFVRKTGAWFSYGDVRLGQGRENSKQFLKDNPDLFNEIREKILAARDLGEGKTDSEKAANKPSSAGKADVAAGPKKKSPVAAGRGA
ncbi:MAG: DNA recombination/repair protein RecA, partial [Phycisphaerae bacterium]